eukprot:TRINITY_DN112625_c0_g1_i1.p1 TRINITY_DN112625_c0_g1~~TRINITY_DN112625_c0_g1_i1.p1  ORF type:complete len:354 (+),score=93.81 TRINITY_DN112625_c0_g1_i1:92-1153(+)
MQAGQPGRPGRAACCAAAAATLAFAGTVGRSEAFLQPAGTGAPSAPAASLRGATSLGERQELQSGAYAANSAAVATVAACGALFAGLAQQRRERPRRQAGNAVACKATRAEWNQRVKRIEGNRAVFEVSIPKPLGLIPQNFGKRPGVGIAKIKDEGNTYKHNWRILIEDEPGMFVLEGDEVVAVNGQYCEGGDKDQIGDIIKNSEGDSVTLKLARNFHLGPVKVVFEPGHHMITMKRGPFLRNGAEAAGADVKYGCRDGFCSSCWHAEESTMLIHRICRMAIPKDWDNVQPMKLLRSDEVRNRTGMSVYSLMQADGIIPPPPPGVDGEVLRKEMTRDREAGGNGKTMFSRDTW